jgi:hypothetical protein
MPNNSETRTREPINLAVQSLSEYENKLQEKDKELSESHKTGATISLNSQKYEQIFSTRFAKEGSLPWKKGIVKISTENGQTIYRLFHGGGIEGELCLLDDISLRMLGIKKTPNEITLKPAPRFTGRFWFYWEHPNEAARVSFKSGVFYFIVSTVLTVIGFLK